MILICIRDSSRAAKYDGLYSLQHSCHNVQPLDRDNRLEIVWLRAFFSSVLTYKKSYALFISLLAVSFFGVTAELRTQNSVVPSVSFIVVPARSITIYCMPLSSTFGICDFVDFFFFSVFSAIVFSCAIASKKRTLCARLCTMSFQLRFEKVFQNDFTMPLIPYIIRALHTSDKP